MKTLSVGRFLVGAYLLVCLLIPSAAALAQAPQSSPGCAVPANEVFGSKDKTEVSIEGKIYFLPEGTGALPDFGALKSQGVIYASKWDIDVRPFENGFPGVTDRFEWFAIDYRGPIYVPAAGAYKFRLGSDDGSILYVDGEPVIENDGVHSWTEHEGVVTLTQGDHAFRLSYFQGPATEIGLVLWVTPPGGEERVFRLQDFNRNVIESRSRLAVDETAEEIRVNFGSEVLFDTGKFELKPAATDALNQLATLLRSYPGYPINIEGHTDSVGRPNDNQILSQNRANAVRKWLVESGRVPEGCISTVGFGQTRPVASNDTPDGRQKNRRVEVRLAKPEPKG
jgi:outer membrane protein OmpA-like peptidoglycan-associated protein